MSPQTMDQLSLWQYTAMVEEHNLRQEEEEVQVEPWTPEEFKAELQALRDRGDPSIKV